ncbi:MAG: GNAT family N-acetyltransferase, partial [Myxococcales bacterium]|nr:GNAT family N-acetyltransferase [Myxococcales bacterium]
SPPDEHGYCSFGVSVDVARPAAGLAKYVVAEVNRQMPRTLGESTIHVSEIDAAIETDRWIYQHPRKAPNEVQQRIGAHVATLVDDGATLQLGIGGVADAVLSSLTQHRDLGIHTEMFSDGVLDLVEAGVVTGAQKKYQPGLIVASFVMGSQRLYDFVDDNPMVALYPSSYTNDPFVIARHEEMTAINSAIEVDLTGQVCADSLGPKLWSGIGGQVDFIRGAAMSRGGKPIIALPSTAKDGAVSRIVPHLDEGAGVVTSRGDVHYVVTEFGVAYLHGKTIRERALALMGIAHPDFRQELLDYVKERKYVYGDEPVNPHRSYPAPEEHFYEFGDERWLVRPLKPTDERRLQEFFYSHKPETVYNRYFAVKKSLGHREASELCCVDYRDRMAYGVFENREHGHRIIAVGRYYLDNRRNRAEIAVVVHEERRRRGIARHLISQLRLYAKKQGITGFYSEVLPSNKPVLEMHRRLGHDVIWSPDEGIYRIQYSLADEPPVEA